MRYSISPEDAARMIYARELTPVNVESTFTRPCNDCHSLHSHIAPVSWILASHVTSGRADLNFSEWAAYVYNSEFRDALVDLRDAGFIGAQIQVAYASECAKISQLDHAVASEHASSESCGAHGDSATANFSGRAVILGSAATVVLLLSVPSSALAFEP